MNTIKNIYFPQFKKIFLGIFTGMLGFWVSTGIVFFILMVIFFVFVSTLSNQYARIYKETEDLSGALDRYALKKDLYSEVWTTSKKQEADIYDKEVENCKSFLKEKDDHLEAIFLIHDREKGLMKLEDEALWKNEYEKRVSGLLTKLEVNHIAGSEGAWPFQKWGQEIPTWDAILSVQKRFWILEAIANIILNNPGITKLGKITFKDTCSSYDPSFTQIYTAIPITVRVELQADRIQFLLHAILKSDIPFIIEGVTILSADKILNPNLSMEDQVDLNKGMNNNISNLIIDVTIDAYVIDYKT